MPEWQVYPMLNGVQYTWALSQNSIEVLFGRIRGEMGNLTAVVPTERSEE